MKLKIEVETLVEDDRFDAIVKLLEQKRLDGEIVIGIVLTNTLLTSLDISTGFFSHEGKEIVLRGFAETAMIE